MVLTHSFTLDFKMKKQIPKILLLFAWIFVFASVHVASYFNFDTQDKYRVPITHDYHMDFSFDQWFKGRYQLNSDRYYRENYGLRNIAVRSKNQLDYWFFHETSSKDVIVGKNGYLYEKNYIESYLGINYIGTDSIESQVNRLKKVQDTLAKMGKHLIVIIAPGKGHYLPEYIPEKFVRQNKKTNYSEFIRIVKRKHVEVLDLNGYFLSQKKNTPYPLYGKNGIHWSRYGLCIAIDQVLKHTETSCSRNLITASWNSIEIDDERPYDYDIANGMYLMTKLKGNKMAYPKLFYSDEFLSAKPKTIVIADSYYWGMYNSGITQAFESNSFWYYNRQVFPDSYTTLTYVDQKDLSQEIASNDLFIILCTEGNMHNFGWGFLEKMEKELYSP